MTTNSSLIRFDMPRLSVSDQLLNYGNAAHSTQIESDQNSIVSLEPLQERPAFVLGERVVRPIIDGIGSSFNYALNVVTDLASAVDDLALRFFRILPVASAAEVPASRDGEVDEGDDCDFQGATIPEVIIGDDGTRRKVDFQSVFHNCKNRRNYQKTYVDPNIRRIEDLPTPISSTLYNFQPHNLQDQKGNRPLHLAIQKEAFSMVETLLKHGSKVAETDGHGKTPVEYAREAKSSSILGLLNKYDANVPHENDVSMPEGKAENGEQRSDTTNGASSVLRDEGYTVVGVHPGANVEEVSGVEACMVKTTVNGESVCYKTTEEFLNANNK